MILNVDYTSPRGCNIYGFRRGMKLMSRVNERGVLEVKSPKTGVYMRVKQNGGRIFIRSMSGEAMVAFSKVSQHRDKEMIYIHTYYTGKFNGVKHVRVHDSYDSAKAQWLVLGGDVNSYRVAE